MRVPGRTAAILRLAGSPNHPLRRSRLRYRPLLWWLAVIALALAGILAYSPNPRLRRHLVPLSLFGAALFAAGWAVGGAEAVGGG
jgi:hypothetical protein